jgi:hypothetical protein
MKLPTALGFAIAAQIHVSHTPEIIGFRVPRNFSVAVSVPLLIERFRCKDKASSIGKQDQHSALIAVRLQYSDGIVGGCHMGNFMAIATCVSVARSVAKEA